VTVPLILFSDAAAAPSGLARITRDLAMRIHTEMSDTFRVATLGYGSPGSSKLPFMQYHWTQRDDFLPLELPFIVKDFYPDDPFILLTIGDVQRFLPLADPKFAQDRKFGDWFSQMRKSGMMKLWGYFPIDAHSVGGELGPQLGHTLSHYDRRVVPSEWAKEIVRKTLPEHECSAIPHGIETSIFHPYPREAARDEFGARLAEVMEWPRQPIDIPDDALWIGIVATNQSRKDWALGIEIASELKKTRPVALWCHTDRLKHEWSILELLSDFGLLTSSIVTVGNVSDVVMAESYSAMDITLGIGRGEGFGYPIFESIFCGTPCFAYAYGAHADWMDESHLIPATSHRIEGPLNLLRPTGQAGYWTHRILPELNKQITRPNELDWINLWPTWKEWLLEGAK
jgi:glycosyltransferase involved in cell wall biosynthesis